MGVKSVKTSKAFTIVEIIIVITVVAILSSLAIITFNSVRQDSRDAKRQVNAVTISEALEKYYEQNGEYPSVASIANSQTSNTGEAVAEKLSVPIESLVMPNTPSGTTNSIAAGTEPSNDSLAYEGQGSNVSSCQSDPNGGCDSYTLRYVKESTQDVIEIESRRGSRVANNSTPELEVFATNPTTISANWSTIGGATGYTLQRSLSASMSSPVTTAHESTNATITDLNPNTEYFFTVRATLDTSVSDWSEVQSASTSSLAIPTGTITIVASLSGNNARGTAGGGSCPAGTTIERQIRYQVNSGDWQAWTTGSPRDVAATEGYTYTFQAQARCVATGNNGPWVQSGTHSVARGITEPSGLTISAAMSGTNARGTAGGGACASGTTIERQIRYQVNGGAWQAYTGVASYRDVAATSGYTYNFQQQARCGNAYGNSAWAASGTSAVTRTVAAPSGLTISAAMSGTNARGTAGGGSCPAGTTIERQVRYAASNTSAVGTYVAYATVSSYRDVAANQGYRYTFQQQARCTGTNASSGWVESGTSSIVRAITTVPSVPVVNSAISGDNVRFSWSAVACPTGTTAQYNGAETANHSPTSSAWGPSSATLRDRFSYDGHTYTMRVQARCVSTHSTGNYSGWSNTASRLRPVAPPVGNPSNFSHTYYSSSNSSTLSCTGSSPGTRHCRMFRWTQPTCRANAVPAYNWNSYMANFAWAATGSAGWRYSPSTAWSDYLEYDEQGWFWSPSQNAYPSSGMNATIRLRYLCSNRTTGQVSSYGTTVQSPGFN